MGNIQKSLLIVGSLALLPGLAGAAPPIGDPNGIYVMSDAHSELYQFDRVAPWGHVPGNYAGALGGSYSQVFSNSAEIAGNAPYLGAVAGTNQNFFIGGFGSLQMINSSTGANIMSVAGGQRLGPAKAPNGNIVVGGPTGIEEYNSNTGAFVRTINSVGDGRNLFTFQGNEMFVANWGSSANSFDIQRYNFITGASSGATIPVSFAPQEIAIGPDGALYASALYEGPPTEGLWRYDFGTSSWSQFINTSSLAGGGPHGFTWDPQNLDIYMAFNSGEIYRFDQAGAFLNLANAVPTKLTDILFKRNVPAPGALTVLVAGAALATRRRRGS